MSKTVSVDCGRFSFWAFDLSLGIWLKKALEVLEGEAWSGPADPGPEERRVWETVAGLGANAVLDLTPRTLDTVRRERFALLNQAVQDWLMGRAHIPGPELSGWRVLGDMHISRADAPAYARDGWPTAPVAALGRSLVQAVNDELPPPPPRTWWCFGWREEPVTIDMSEAAPRGW